jgi:drug/metabolite transporter (DMT)-like permease
LPYLRLLGGQVAIGAAAIFARYALTGAGPLAVSAARLVLAALVLLLFAGGLGRLSPRREIAFSLAGLALAVHFATWIASLEYTSVAISTLLVTTSPLWTETYDIVRERRPPSPAFVLSLVLGFAGVALVALHGSSAAPPVRGHELLGDALALAGSFAIGVYLLIVRAAGANAGSARLATRAIVVRTYGWAALALVIVASLAHEAPPGPANLVAWGGIVAMALVSQLLGHTALNAALRDFRPSVVALSTLAEPVAAAALAALLFGELLGPATIAGGALVLTSVAIALATPRSGAAEALSTEISS